MKGKIRSSRGDWPDLDHALFEWQQCIEQKKAIITGKILKTKARELWAALLQFDDIKEPKWSNGWLEEFKKRFNIKEYVQYREAGSAAIDNPDNIAQIEEVQYLCIQYKLRDILNMDKTGLNWKRTPDCTLVTKSYHSTKKSKD
jgi:hypothetical protein